MMLPPWRDLSRVRRKALEVFLDGNPHTRSEIAAAVGQSAPSATAHIDALLERGLVAPVDETNGGGDSTTGTRTGAPGRPAASFRLCPERALALGMELRPSLDERSPAHLTAQLVQIDGTVVGERRIDLPTTALRAIRSVVLEEARRTLADLEQTGVPAGTAPASARTPNVSGKQGADRQPTAAPVVGLGLSLPGVVDCDRQFLIHAPNLFLSRVSFAGLAEELQLPVYVDNEANAAALAEYVLWDRASAGSTTPKAGAQPPAGSLVRISITEGVGAGIIVDGRLMRGDTWRAGEFGHMAIRDGSRRCNCGRTGCWEQYVSERALLREARAAGLHCPDVGSFITILAGGGVTARSPGGWYPTHSDSAGGSGPEPLTGGVRGPLPGGVRGPLPGVDSAGRRGGAVPPTADERGWPSGHDAVGRRGPARGDARARAVWNRYIDALAVGIENVAACVDPGTIIVGGEIAVAGESLVGPLRQAVEAVSFLTSGIRVAGSALPASAPVTGAALLAFGDLYPAAWGDRSPGGAAGGVVNGTNRNTAGASAAM